MTTFYLWTEIDTGPLVLQLDHNQMSDRGTCVNVLASPNSSVDEKTEKETNHKFDNFAFIVCIMNFAPLNRL